jgi:hypothetical protein
LQCPRYWNNMSINRWMDKEILHTHTQTQTHWITI